MNTRSRNRLLAWALLASYVSTFAAMVFTIANPRVIKIADEAVFDAVVNANGWVGAADPALVVSETRGEPQFADTPAGKAAQGDNLDVWLWDAHRKVTGDLPSGFNQLDVGSCVGHGGARAAERTLIADILNGLAFGEFRHLSEEYIYGTSRYQVGGNKIRGDGSLGIWSVKALTEYGSLPKSKFDFADLTQYSTSLCRSWGRTGPTAKALEEGKRFKLAAYAQVKTWSEAKKSLDSGYGISVCSNVGFKRNRDQNGVCVPGPVWNHCMCLDGYHRDPVSGREYGHIENSWGPDYFTGPTGWGSPSAWGFWAEASVIERMLRQGDSWSVSGHPGFPVKKINWFAEAPKPRGNAKEAAVLAIALAF